MRNSLLVGVLIGLLAFAMVAVATWRTVSPPGTTPAEQADSEIDRALSERTSFDFYNTPLEAVLRQFQRRHRIPILIDHAAVANDLQVSEALVTCSARRVTLRSALRIILRHKQLTYSILDQSLVVTTHSAQSEGHQPTKIYPVLDLMQCVSAGEVIEDDAGLSELAQRISPRFGMDSDNYVAHVEPGSASLIASGATAWHEELTDLLDALRRAPQLGTAGSSSTMAPWPARPESPCYARIERALDSEVCWAFDRVPLAQVFAQLESEFRFDVQFDEYALDVAGLDREMRVTLRMPPVSLRAALRRLLEPLQLTYLVRNESLLITTVDAAAEDLTLVVYPVLDLLDLPDETARPTELIDVRLAAIALREVIEKSVCPELWKRVGGRGVLAPFAPRGVLVCRQTDEVQQKVAALLASLRQARNRPGWRSRPQSEELVTRIYWVGVATEDKDPFAEDESPSLPQPEFPPAEIAKLVRQSIEPQSWADSGAFVEVVRKRLIIRHTPRVHRHVETFLRGLSLHPPGRVLRHTARQTVFDNPPSGRPVQGGGGMF